MTLPWLKTIPRQMNLFGDFCPVCEESKDILYSSMVFEEGIDLICKDCVGYKELSDSYVFPKFEDFKKRVLRAKK